MIINVPARVPDAVQSIKAVRRITGLGLKEAKDLVFKPGDHFLKINLPSPATSTDPFSATPFEAEIRTLKANGIIVKLGPQWIVDELRRLHTFAVHEGCDEFAEELSVLLTAETLRGH